MDIADADSFFDDDPVYDAYTGELLFHCHTTPHDDHTSSGATARRRTMTTINGTVAPARRVVTVYGDAWLVGNSNPDGFQGDLIRRSYGLKKSTGLMAAMSPAMACLGGIGTELHAHKEYYRDNQDMRTSADWDTMWNIFCAPGEPVMKGAFLRQGGVLYRVRNVYPSIEELLVAEADQLDDDAFQGATFTSTTLDEATDTETASSIATTVIQMDLARCYEFRTLAEADVRPGDRAVFVAKSTLQPPVGAALTMLGARWRVLAVVSSGDAWNLHVRLA